MVPDLSIISGIFLAMRLVGSEKKQKENKFVNNRDSFWENLKTYYINQRPPMSIKHLIFQLY